MPSSDANQPMDLNAASSMKAVERQNSCGAESGSVRERSPSSSNTPTPLRVSASPPEKTPDASLLEPISESHVTELPAIPSASPMRSVCSSEKDRDSPLRKSNSSSEHTFGKKDHDTDEKKTATLASSTAAVPLADPTSATSSSQPHFGPPKRW